METLRVPPPTTGAHCLGSGWWGQVGVPGDEEAAAAAWLCRRLLLLSGLAPWDVLTFGMN